MSDKKTRRYCVQLCPDFYGNTPELLHFDASEVNAKNSRLQFMLDGRIVGEAKGDIIGWWREREPEDGLDGSTTYEVVFCDREITISATDTELNKVGTERRVFTIGDEVVASLNDHYCTSWREDPNPF